MISTASARWRAWSSTSRVCRVCGRRTVGGSRLRIGDCIRRICPLHSGAIGRGPHGSLTPRSSAVRLHGQLPFHFSRLFERYRYLSDVVGGTVADNRPVLLRQNDMTSYRERG